MSYNNVSELLTSIAVQLFLLEDHLSDTPLARSSLERIKQDLAEVHFLMHAGSFSVEHCGREKGVFPGGITLPSLRVVQAGS